MKTKDLFSTLYMGELTIPNRLVMAPLTRCRAEKGFLPSDMAPIYYSQRASVGLIISEATQITQQGQGYIDTPGIYSPEQVTAWQRIVKAVHGNQGKIFLQLWHVGRHSHSDFQPGNELPIAPSAIKEFGHITTPSGKKDTETPRALEASEVKAIVADYKIAAQNALEAGFDGIEIHGANGYLINQFLEDGTNKRKDEYGGTVRKRYVFLKEVLEAVIDVWGPSRVGLRLSPGGSHCDVSDSRPIYHYDFFIRELNKFPLAYLHLIEPLLEDADHYGIPYRSVIPHYRKIYRGILIGASEYDQTTADSAIQDGEADMVAFGRLMISNPDLMERFKNNWPLNTYNVSTFMGGGEEGYIDYPFFYQKKTLDSL